VPLARPSQPPVDLGQLYLLRFVQGDAARGPGSGRRGDARAAGQMGVYLTGDLSPELGLELVVQEVFPIGQ
jgi:hypothetical protein